MHSVFLVGYRDGASTTARFGRHGSEARPSEGPRDEGDGPRDNGEGQVEKNVQDARNRMWQVMPVFADLAELNQWLEDRHAVGVLSARRFALWAETPHKALPGSIAHVWEAEKPLLMALPPAFDGFIEHSKRVSPTCLITFERNRYSVPASFANHRISLHVYPNKLVIVAEGHTVCEHARIINRSHRKPGKVIYDWRHYLALAIVLGPSPSSLGPRAHPWRPDKGSLQRKPGALRNGAPFTEMPAAFRQLQDHMLRKDGGDREMVDILSRVLQHVMPKACFQHVMPKACFQHDEEDVLCAVELALEAGVPTKTHILNPARID